MLAMIALLTNGEPLPEEKDSMTINVIYQTAEDGLADTIKPACPILYRTTAELIDAGLLPENFPIEMESLSFDSFAADILDSYGKRFDISNILD